MWAQPDGPALGLDPDDGSGGFYVSEAVGSACTGYGKARLRLPITGLVLLLAGEDVTLARAKSENPLFSLAASHPPSGCWTLAAPSSGTYLTGW